MIDVLPSEECRYKGLEGSIVNVADELAIVQKKKRKKKGRKRINTDCEKHAALIP